MITLQIGRCNKPFTFEFPLCERPKELKFCQTTIVGLIKVHEQLFSDVMTKTEPTSVYSYIEKVRSLIYEELQDIYKTLDQNGVEFDISEIENTVVFGLKKYVAKLLQHRLSNNTSTVDEIVSVEKTFTPIDDISMDEIREQGFNPDHFSMFKKLICDTDFTCPICHLIILEPVTSTCGHNFCKQCVKDHLHTISRNVTRCPVCKHQDALKDQSINKLLCKVIYAVNPKVFEEYKKRVRLLNIKNTFIKSNEFQHINRLVSNNVTFYINEKSFGVISNIVEFSMLELTLDKNFSKFNNFDLLIKHIIIEHIKSDNNIQITGSVIYNNDFLNSYLSQQNTQYDVTSVQSYAFAISFNDYLTQHRGSIRYKYATMFLQQTDPEFFKLLLTPIDDTGLDRFIYINQEQLFENYQSVLLQDEDSTNEEYATYEESRPVRIVREVQAMSRSRSRSRSASPTISRASSPTRDDTRMEPTVGSHADPPTNLETVEIPRSREATQGLSRLIRRDMNRSVGLISPFARPTNGETMEEIN